MAHTATTTAAVTPNPATTGIGSYYGPGQQFSWPTQTAAGDYNDPYNLYLSAAPIMQQNATREIQGAMANAGFGGNRYGSSAMQQAGQIGANTSLQMNDMLTQLMYNQTNQDLDRQMQAAGMYLQATPMVENALSSRYGAKADALAARMRAFEQQRAAAMSAQRMRYSDFEKNKYGTLPMLMGALTNSIGQGPEPIITTKGGSSGVGSDVMNALALYFGSR